MEKPKSLYHYTSIDVMCKLFTNIQDDLFIFHASSTETMNDGAEYEFVREQCSDESTEIIMEKELGIPFALCFSESGECVPMWTMYANKGNGVCLKFNFDKLGEYFKELKKGDNRSMSFSKCMYKPINANKKKKPFSVSDTYPDIDQLKKNMIETSFIKPKCFSYEQEWRLMVWQDWLPNKKNNIAFKVRQDILCPYIEIPVSINSLEEIIIKPDAPTQLINATQLLRTNYGGLSIPVNPASITLKV